MAAIKALIIEDDLNLSESIGDFLETRDIQVDYIYTARGALSLLSKETFDILLLDINLPDINGFELCEKIKTDLKCDTPVIVMTARTELEDKLTGFSVGAEDYLVKPFAMEELLARMIVLVNRGFKVDTQLVVGNIEYDLASQMITREGVRIELNLSCKEILKVLMQKHPKVVRRDALENALWGSNVPNSDVLKIHIHTLRQRLDKPFNKHSIESVRGIGYRLVI